MSQLRRRPYARRPRRPPLRLGPGAALCFFLAWPGPSRVSDGGLRALSSQRSVLQLNPTRLAPRCWPCQRGVVLRCSHCSQAPWLRVGCRAAVPVEFGVLGHPPPLRLRHHQKHQHQQHQNAPTAQPSLTQQQRPRPLQATVVTNHRQNHHSNVLGPRDSAGAQRG